MNYRREALSTFLAVTRAVQITDGPIYALDSQNVEQAAQAVRIKRVTVRGSISNYADAYKDKKDGDVLCNPDAPNPQQVDVAYLPFDKDRLELRFGMKVMAISDDNISCNNANNTEKLSKFIKAYRETEGFLTIANLLSWTIAAAIPLWRNRFGVDRTVIVRDELNRDQSIIYQGNADKVNAKIPDTDSSRDLLIKRLSETLSDSAPTLIMNIRMGCTIGVNQEVFPSQDFAPDNKENCSKYLYSINDEKGGRIAALHPQKIWAGLRMIDVWHQDFEQIGPLSVEPLGYSHKYQQAYRKPDTYQDLYSCLMAIDDLTKDLEKGIVNKDSHFLMANLMRGGVFSAGKIKSAKDKDTEVAPNPQNKLF